MARAKQLQKYTYEMEKLDRKGRYDTACRALEQVKRNNESELAQAEAARDSANRAYDKEKERYERYQQQLEKCKIYAPQDGMVAFSMGDRRNRGTVIEEGAFVRERQEILTLPDLARMQVNTAVHESVLDQVHPGLKAIIRVDAFPDRSYQGSVKSVAVLPDQGGWLSSDTKVYKTIVTINEQVTQLKPGMTAVVEVDIEKLTNVLSVPIQAIIQRGRENWCYVQADSGVQKRVVTLGKTNDKFVEVKQGLEEYDVVVLNPMSLVDEETAAKRNKDKKADKEHAEDGQDAEEEPASDAGAGGPGGPAAAQKRGSRPGTPGPEARGNGVAGPQAAPGAGAKGRGPGGRGGAAFARFDKDKDGKITKEELPENLQPMFDQLDRNKDGVISGDEISQRPGGGARKSPRKEQ